MMQIDGRGARRSIGTVESCAQRHAEIQKAHEECNRAVELFRHGIIRSGAFRRGYEVSVVYETIAARAADDGDWELGSANT